ncbi:MAG: glycoside hydrolase family 43 protein [Prevotella sp.]|nr:glycoside hydrolase family 43 protein [Prevotella sp.]
MKKAFVSLCLFFVSLIATAQTFHNPIIPGFHPDPSICRVGDDFYLVNSSFQYFPGVPIFHSRDLIHWEQIGNVLDRESQLPLKNATSWLGIYAPTIRYHDGVFYMITTNVGNGGNFMVTAKDPHGPWSEPIWLKQDGIDPSLWFENGKCYMMSNPDNTIMLCEINPQTGEQLTESRPLWQGTGGRYPEGPHIYKKDGWYYLLISEGGTELAHHLTIARSRNIYGPYEANPQNPILTNCSRKGQGMQVQGTGHGDFVQAKDGSWWVVFLAYRNYGGSYHHLGRETYLAPVSWPKGEWPVVNNNEPIDTLMTAPLHIADSKQIQKRETTVPSFGPEWVYIQNPKRKVEIQEGVAWCGVKTTNVRLYASSSSLTQNERPAFFGRRQESDNFTLEANVNPSANLVKGDEAGISVYQINDGHLDFFIRRDADGYSLVLRCKLKSIDYVVAEKKLPVSPQQILIRVRGADDKYHFEYQDLTDLTSIDNDKWQSLGAMDCSLMSTEVAGGFTGVMVGVYAYAATESDKAYADFPLIVYQEQ